MGRHRTSVDVSEALRLQLRRALDEEKAPYADTGILTRRLTVGLKPIKPTGRSTVEACPNEAFPVPVLMDAMTDEARLLMTTSWS